LTESGNGNKAQHACVCLKVQFKEKNSSLQFCVKAKYKKKIHTKTSISFHVFFLKIQIDSCCLRHWCWSSELRFTDSCVRLSWSEI